MIFGNLDLNYLLNFQNLFLVFGETYHSFLMMMYSVLEKWKEKNDVFIGKRKHESK